MDAGEAFITDELYPGNLIGMEDPLSHEAILAKTRERVHQTLEPGRPGHDWWHIEMVWRNSLRIGKEEGADLFVVQLAALLHDIADYKFNNGDEKEGPRVAREWLTGLGLEETTIEQVCQIIEEVTFRGAGTQVSPLSSLESMVVQDADRLDAIGAIGIARAFAYGGYKERPMHDPLIAPQPHASFEEYKTNNSATINHFYEKLLLLRDRMNTDTARRIAGGRHAFMEEYLQRFLREWDGED